MTALTLILIVLGWAQLNFRINKIMASQATAAADIKLVTEQLVKIGSESTKTLERLKVVEDILANGGETVTQELIDAVAALKVQAQVVDDLTPDAPAPTP